MLHPEVEVTITVNVARSADEAERLARGEDVTVRREGGDGRGRSRGGQGRGGSLLRAGRRRGRAEGDDEAAAEEQPAKA